MTWFYVSHEQCQPYYVEADSPADAIDLMEQHRGLREGLNIEEYGEELDYDEALDTPQPPFRSIEDHGGDILLHEKRVNQAGSKGVYRVLMR